MIMKHNPIRFVETSILVYIVHIIINACSFQYLRRLPGSIRKKNEFLVPPPGCILRYISAKRRSLCTYASAPTGLCLPTLSTASPVPIRSLHPVTAIPQDPLLLLTSSFPTPHPLRQHACGHPRIQHVTPVQVSSAKKNKKKGKRKGVSSFSM